MENNFFDRVTQAPRPVVVDFWAPWCVPCRTIEPVMKDLSLKYTGRVDVWKVNADEQPDVLHSLHIYGIPTLIAYKNGKEVARHTGAASGTALSKLFDAALSGDKPVQTGPALLDRLLRLAIGGAMFILSFLGYFAGFYLFLAGLGVLIAFSAVYDRCPIYRVVSMRVKAWLNKNQPG